MENTFLSFKLSQKLILVLAPITMFAFIVLWPHRSEIFVPTLGIQYFPEDDPLLVEYIRDWVVDPLPGREQHYNFAKELKLEGQIGVPPIVDSILGEKRNGFFIECGAYDGEALSNSLLFEIKRNWTGLLIEPDFISYASLKRKNRKAYLANACLSGNHHAERLRFQIAPMIGGIADASLADQNLQANRNKSTQAFSVVGCFPLYSILLAIGNPTVDYFSLDIEGAEWSVVRSLPWDKVDIRVMSVEHAHLGDDREKLENHLKNNGYDVYQYVEFDTIFVKRTL